MPYLLGPLVSPCCHEKSLTPKPSLELASTSHHILDKRVQTETIPPQPCAHLCIRTAQKDNKRTSRVPHHTSVQAVFETPSHCCGYLVSIWQRARLVGAPCKPCVTRAFRNGLYPIRVTTRGWNAGTVHMNRCRAGDCLRSELPWWNAKIRHCSVSVGTEREVLSTHADQA